MTCPRCGRRVKNSKGERVRYCKCGICNHCHECGVISGATLISTMRAIGDGDLWKKKINLH